ncbi:MAG TPA: hypothetical protein VKE94_10675, partial [Gemmataceae bacterium]|nr:hypothetical protein [Gemmataceae bacterium]
MSRHDTDKNANVPELLPRPATPALRPTGVPAWRGAALAKAAASGSDTSALLKALARRWPVALVLGLILAAAAGAAGWFLLAAP